MLTYLRHTAADENLHRLSKKDIYESATIIEWATSVLPVVKAGGKSILYGDLKITANEVLKLEMCSLQNLKTFSAY